MLGILSASKLHNYCGSTRNQMLREEKRPVISSIYCIVSPPNVNIFSSAPQSISKKTSAPHSINKKTSLLKVYNSFKMRYTAVLTVLG